MNVALGAVFIFILLTPPIAFYVSYGFGRFSKAGPKFSLLDGLLASAIFSLFIHAIGVLIIGLIPGLGTVRFDLLLKLVGGELKDVESKFSSGVLTTALLQFALYSTVIFVLAIALGRVWRWCVLKLEWHHNNELLRLNNKWWYLFNGYYLPELGFEGRDFDLLFVDVVVDLKDATMIYSGYLVDFVCNGEELDRIYLSDTVKRSYAKPSDHEGEPQEHSAGEPVSIPGAFFSIAYKDIKNINLRFLTFDLSEEEIDGILEEDMPKNP